MNDKNKSAIEQLGEVIQELASSILDLGRILSGEVKDDKTSQEIIDQAIDKLDKPK